ncbi:MAG: DUF4333 domain-containing protein [Pseudonocardia sp.]
MFSFFSIVRAAATSGVVGVFLVGLGACGSTAVAADQVEQDINQLVQREVGRPAASIACPDLPAEVGGSVRCGVRTADGVQHGVTVTVISVEGSKTNYVIEVD